MLTRLGPRPARTHVFGRRGLAHTYGDELDLDQVTFCSCLTGEILTLTMLFEKSTTVSPEEIRSIDVSDLAGALAADRDGRLGHLISAYLQEWRFKVKSLVDRGVTPAEHAAYKEVEQGIDAAERVLTAAAKANALREPR